MSKVWSRSTSHCFPKEVAVVAIVDNLVGGQLRRRHSSRNGPTPLITAFAVFIFACR